MTTRRHPGRAVREERGFALPIALGTMLVLAILLVGIISYTTANSRTAYLSNSRQQSYTLAQAGLNNAISVIRTSSTPMWSGLLPSTTTSYSGGSVTWSGTLDDVTPGTTCNMPNDAALIGCWTITSTGDVRNPAGAADSKLKLSVRVPLEGEFSQLLVNPAYDYVYVYGTGAASGCDFANSNNSTFGSRLYVQGNMCISNNTQVTNEVNVGGHAAFTSPQASIGTSSTYDTYGVHIVGGCSTSSSGPFTPWACGTAQHVYANPVADKNVASLTPPDIIGSAQGWYKSASPGPFAPCKTSSGLPSNTSNWATAFDNNVPAGAAPATTWLDRSETATFNLTPSTAYSCTTSLGQISWDPSAKDANGNTVPTLTVKGTVFIDGNARIAPSSIQLIRYVGVGSIYLSGSFVLKGTNVCAAYIFSSKDCDWSLPGSGHWDVSSNFLNIVAGVVGGGGQTETPDSSTSVELQTAHYQGAITAALKIDVSSATVTQGPLVEQQMTLGQALTTYPFGTLTSVPSATPGNPISAVKLLKPTLYTG
jgi:Tfp pilus assembly protein PilX